MTPPADPESTPEDRLLARWPAVVDRYFEVGLDGLSLSDRQFFLLFHLLSEMEEGGLDQFFSNEAGHLAPESAAALGELGFESEANHLQKAIRLFPQGVPPQDQQERIRIINSLPDETLAIWEAVTEIIMDSADDIVERLDQAVAPTDSPLP